MDQCAPYPPSVEGEDLKLGVLCPQREVVRHGPGGAQIPAALVKITAQKSSFKDMFKKDANAIYCTYLSQLVLSTPTTPELEGSVAHTTARRPNNTHEPPGMGIIYVPQVWYIS